MVLFSQRYILAYVAFFGHLSLSWLQLITREYNGSYYSRSELYTANTVYNFGLTCACFGGILVTRFGGASLFGIAILSVGSVGVITNLLSHLIFRLPFILLSLAIFLQGFLHSIAQCSVADLWARWSAPEERFKLVAVTSLGNYVGEISYPLLYRFIDNWYHDYIIGGIACIWALLWMYVLKVKNDPDDDKHVSDDEKQYLANEIQMADKDRHNVTSYPWKSIFTSLPFWILCLTTFIFTMGETFTWYIREDPTIQRFTRKSTIVTEAIEIVLILIVAYASYWIAKKKKYTYIQTRKFYISLLFVIGAKSLTAYFYYRQYFQYDDFELVQESVHEYLKIAFLVNAIDLSPKYSGILYGIQTSLIMIAVPVTQRLISLVRIVTAHDENRAFSICYKVVIVLYLLCALLYRCCGSGELQPWNNPRREQLELQARKNGDTA